ncbi:4-hydroxybenzoate octaprenyltransferase [Zoogloea oleivorans]|uniref:4-hydroxybenzoate octaprenyltransferase n=1 Tax=Zoogloea oleivorans TaxID=1552750 RepID=A0A6C2D193_9RHOO|nr:4-hydroxybenzoate octaprenyltransferase [Zoogloea oleivorans]TYC60117.1 4-hydroxybenzoate octaprenyltransferase [Zoogloea oleivorans]
MSTLTLRQRVSEYEKLMRLDKPIGILLLLWPTLWALWVAGAGRPSLLVVAIFVIGTVLMRSAGCVINDYADRNFDGHVERTRNRPLAAGRVRPKEALLLAAGLSVLSFLLILPLNGLTIALSVPALFLAGSYPFTKRFLAIPQAYLGIAFGFGIPMSFAALQGEVPLVGWVMLIANVFWAVAYDTEYAMVDRPDDLKIGIKTSAITFGRFEVTAIMVCYAATLLLVGWAGLHTGRGAAFIAGLAVAAGMMGYHYMLIRDRDRPRCFKAFLHNNWVGGVIFAGWAVDYLLNPAI